MMEQEIIKELATKVMEWEIRRVNYQSDGSFYEAYFENGEFLGYCDSIEWNPIKYIEDAWKLVEKLRKTSVRWIGVETGYEFNGYRCQVILNSGRDFYIDGETAQEAIYKSTLKLIEIL